MVADDPSGAFLTITNNLTLDGGTLTVRDAQVGFSGGGSFSGTGTVALPFANFENPIISSDADLAIDTNVTIRGARGTITAFGNITNFGTILADEPSNQQPTSIEVRPNGPVDRLQNFGTIRAATGGDLRLRNLKNRAGGTVEVADDTAAIELTGDWTNTGGTLALTGGGLGLGGQFAMGDLGTFDRSGGDLYLNGELDNTGQTLTLAETGPLILGGSPITSFPTATILGGTIGPLAAGADLAWFRAILDGVEIGGDLTVSPPPSRTSDVFVRNGLGLDGATLAFAPGSSRTTRLDFFDGPQSVSGTGTIQLPAAGNNGTLQISKTHNGDLFFQSGITIRGAATTFSVGGNQGAIRLRGTAILEGGGMSFNDINRINAGSDRFVVDGGTLRVAADADVRASGLANLGGTVEVQAGGELALVTGFQNTGTIDLDGGTLAFKKDGPVALADLSPFTRDGGTLVLGGVLDNAGQTLTLAGVGPLQVGGNVAGQFYNGTIAGGQIGPFAAGAGLTFGGSVPRLEGVTLADDVTVPRDLTLTIDGGLTLDGGNLIVAERGTIDFPSGTTQTIDGTGEIRLNGGGFSNFASIGRNTTVDAELILEPGITVRGRGQAQVNVRSLVNRGTIVAEPGGAPEFFINRLGSGLNFANAGTLAAADGGRLTVNYRGAADIGMLDLAAGGVIGVRNVSTDASPEVLNEPVTVPENAVLYLNADDAPIDLDADVDLNGWLVLNYPDDGPSAIDEIAAKVQGGYAGGAWTGPGIRSSLAAADPSRAVGYADRATTPNVPLPPTNLAFIDNTTVVVRNTLAGDFDLSGSVNLADFTVLANSFGRTGRLFSQGDANYDGRVNLADFTVLANAFGNSLPAGDDGEGGRFD